MTIHKPATNPDIKSGDFIEVAGKVFYCSMSRFGRQLRPFAIAKDTHPSLWKEYEAAKQVSK